MSGLLLRSWGHLVKKYFEDVVGLVRSSEVIQSTIRLIERNLLLATVRQEGRVYIDLPATVLHREVGRVNRVLKSLIELLVTGGFFRCRVVFDLTCLYKLNTHFTLVCEEASPR